MHWKWANKIYEETNLIFEELKGMEPEQIAMRMRNEGLKMPHPHDQGNINRTCILAQWIENRTGKPVHCGTTSFTFLDEEKYHIIRYPPNNVCLFAQGTFTGKYPDLYLPRQTETQVKNKKKKVLDRHDLSRWADDGGPCYDGPPSE